MAAQPFLIPDLRDPAQRMGSLPVKLPPAVLEDLKAQAALLRCNKSSLARHLIVQGLQGLTELEVA